MSNVEIEKKKKQKVTCVPEEVKALFLINKSTYNKKIIRF